MAWKEHAANRRTLFGERAVVRLLRQKQTPLDRRREKIEGEGKSS